MLELAVRPLRERLDELPWIIDRLGGRADVAVFRAHNWPGNLTELRDALAHSALPRYLHEKGLSAPELPVKTRPGLDAILAAVERRLLENALAETGGNATEAAARLGIVRARFARRLETLKGA